jgi:LysR family transcriptional activator of nhaA
MEHLNYHHLRVFWTVVREGGVTRASEKLHVSQPTVTAQIRSLEDALGQKLFRRAGRNIVLADTGHSVYRYADEMVGLGEELLGMVRGQLPGHRLRLTVGVAMVVPKLIAYRVLEPILKLTEAVRVECLEDTPERLLAELAMFRLDLVLADAPAGPSVSVRAYNHLLGECGVSLCGTDQLAAAYRKGFPRSVDGAPFLLPRRNSALRGALDEWFDRERIRPSIVGEFEDSALMKAFGEAGTGLFPVALPTAAAVRRKYGVREVGRADGVRQRYYAITVERKLRHPAVVAIVGNAARTLFT